MKWTVYYTKKNPYMNSKGKSTFVTYDKDGHPVDEKINTKKTSMPGAEQNYTPKRHFRKNTILIDLGQAELNDLVKRMSWYDKDNKQILEAPINNPAAPFWVHPNCNIRLEYAGMTFDDELPLDAFWLAVMRSDRKNFHFKGTDLSPSIGSAIRFTVTKLGEAVNENLQQADEGLRAFKYLEAMGENTSRMVSMLRAMGVKVSSFTPSENYTEDNYRDTLKSTLFQKITEHKDTMNAGERNIDLFNRLSEDKSGETELRATVREALDKAIIVRNKSNRYKYGQVVLGSSLKASMTFLNDAENSDILQEIMDKIKL